jgi:hypothetical protein
MKLGLKIRLALVAFLVFSVAAPVTSIASEMKHKRYFGLGFHNSTYEKDGDLWNNWDVEGESESSFAVYFGKNSSKIFATEMAYHHLGTFEPDESSEISAGNFSVSLRLNLPTPYVQPFALAGLGFGFISYDVPGWSDSGSGLSTRIGFGARIPVTDRFNIAAYTETVSFDIEVEGGWVNSSHEQEFSMTGLALEYHY